MATKGTILVVDDDADTRDSLREALEAEGFAVVEAANGRKALNYLTSDGVAMPGLILLDLRMPEMSGIELAMLLRIYNRFVTVPLVIMSADLPRMTMIKGATGYLPKPLDKEAMLATIETALSMGP